MKTKKQIIDDRWRLFADFIIGLFLFIWLDGLMWKYGPYNVWIPIFFLLSDNEKMFRELLLLNTHEERLAIKAQRELRWKNFKRNSWRNNPFYYEKKEVESQKIS